MSRASASSPGRSGNPGIVSLVMLTITYRNTEYRFNNHSTCSLYQCHENGKDFSSSRNWTHSLASWASVPTITATRLSNVTISTCLCVTLPGRSVETTTKPIRVMTHQVFNFCLCPCNIYGHINIGTDLWQCALMATLKCYPTGKPDHQPHDLISHTGTLSCHWANQSLPYSNKAKHIARKWLA